jgi:SOS-response transcriptional repressor LexA
VVEGTVVVARVKGGPSFYQFSRNGSAVYLTPAGSDEPATAIEDPDNLHLIGRVVALYRRLDGASILVSTTAH